MTQAVQSVVDATPSAPPIEEWDFPARNLADPVEDRVFDDLDFGDGMWDGLGESEPLGDSSWFMDGFGPMPSVPSNAFGMQDGMELTDGMFPAVPTGVPGASMGEVGADAAGGEELLAVLLV